MAFVVRVGGRLIGPFEDVRVAATYCRRQLQYERWAIVPLDSPAQEAD